MYTVTVRDVPELGVGVCDSSAAVPGGRDSPHVPTGTGTLEFAPGVVAAVADEGPGIGAAAAGPNMLRSHATCLGLNGLAI